MFAYPVIYSMHRYMWVKKPLLIAFAYDNAKGSLFTGEDAWSQNSYRN